MRGILICSCCCSLVGLTKTDAQVQLVHPEQFYTNGEQVDAWTRNGQQRLSSTFWLVKHPTNSLSYKQQLVVVYDNEPNKLYYYDIVSELFIGRYDMEKEQYSLLPKEHRKKRLADIEENMFPPAGEKPKISEMFAPVNDGPPNNAQLMMPPATMMFPRLKDSEWTGFYTDIGANNRRQMMTLTLNGKRGKYEAPKAGIAGELTDIQYDMVDDMPRIRGKWSANNSNVGGGFEFRLMDLNEFQGEYWVRNKPDRRLLWDGKRSSR